MVGVYILICDVGLYYWIAHAYILAYAYANTCVVDKEKANEVDVTLSMM